MNTMGAVDAMVSIHHTILYVFVILSVGLVVSFVLLRHSSKLREKKLEEKDVYLHKLGQKVLCNPISTRNSQEDPTSIYNI